MISSKKKKRKATDRERRAFEWGQMCGFQWADSGIVTMELRNEAFEEWEEHERDIHSTKDDHIPDAKKKVKK